MNIYNTVEWLQQQLDNGLSQRDIATLAKVSPPTIRSWLKKHKIKPRSISEGLLAKSPTLSKRHKERWTTELRAEQSNKMQSVQANRKTELSASAKLNWATNRDAIVSGIRRAANSPARIKKLSDISTALWEKPAYRALISSRLLAIWDNDEFRQKMISRMRQWSNIVGLSDIVKARWSDDDYRERLTAIMAETRDARQQAYKKTLEVTELRACLRQNTISLWQQAEFIAAMKREDVRQRMSESCRKRWLRPEYRQKMLEARSRQPRISSLQQALYKYLDNLNVDYSSEGPATAIGFYSFDCLIRAQNRKILIECQGDYWHSLARAQQNDRSKFTYISKYFPEYEIMYIWEHEFFTKDRVLERLKSRLGIEQVNSYFDFADVKVLLSNSSTTREFYLYFHYLTSQRGGMHIIAKINDIVIAAATFSSPIRQNIASSLGVDEFDLLELSRLCIHPNYHKKNFGSWFLSKCISQLSAKTIVAYADTTVGHQGTIYKASNFKLHHIIEPDYWYVDEDGYVMHKRTLYGRAKKMSLTEAAFAEKYYYFKKYGGPKLCFVYHR